MSDEEQLDKILDNVFGYLEVGEAGIHGTDEEHRSALKQALLAWHQQELERAVAKAYRKGYQAGWSTGDSGGRTTKREEVKAKREAWISKKMKEGQA